MGGLFSKAQPPPPPQQQQQPAAKPLVLTDLQRAKFELKVKKESLERMTKTQSMESANSHERMRAAMQAGDTALARRHAALVLAKRKLRETTLGHIMRVESMMNTMQQAAMNKDLVDNMRAANEQINALLAGMQDAEEIVAESADCIARVDRLSEVLQAPLYGTQESAREVEAELARLMPAAAAGAAAPAAAAGLPAPVPAYIPEVPAAAAAARTRAAAAAVPA